MKNKAKPTMKYTKGVHGKQKKNIFPNSNNNNKDNNKSDCDA